MQPRRLVICYVVAFYCLSGSCFAQLWSGILNPVNPSSKGVKQAAIDWSSAGVPGGIPMACPMFCTSRLLV
jgi:hypothetical protein